MRAFWSLYYVTAIQNLALLWFTEPHEMEEELQPRHFHFKRKNVFTDTEI
jgi:hypothetical protein